MEHSQVHDCTSSTLCLHLGSWVTPRTSRPAHVLDAPVEGESMHHNKPTSSPEISTSLRWEKVSLHSGDFLIVLHQPIA